MLPPLPPEAAASYDEFREWALEAQPTKYFFYRKGEDYPEGGLPEDSSLLATLVESDWGVNILGGKKVLSWGTSGFFLCQVPQSESLMIDASHVEECVDCGGVGLDDDENSCDSCGGSGQDTYYFFDYLAEEGYIIPRF